MTHRMWSLAEFRFDEGIDAAEVFLSLGELEPMTLAEALDIARTTTSSAWPSSPSPQLSGPAWLT